MELELPFLCKWIQRGAKKRKCQTNKKRTGADVIVTHNPESRMTGSQIVKKQKKRIEKLYGILEVISLELALKRQRHPVFRCAHHGGDEPSEYPWAGW